MSNYDEKFVAEVKDWAVMGLTPMQIATRMNLRGEERRAFLNSVFSPKGALHDAYLDARDQYEEDLQNTLVARAVNGDMNAMALQLQQNEKAEYNTLLNKLFGI